MSEPAEQAVYLVPDLTIKELLDAIPAHCFKRSALRSSLYTVWHLSVIAAIYHTATYLDTLISPVGLSPLAYSFAKFALWSLYGFWVGLFGTGIWVIGHEAGHQAYSESKLINNTVGWILHSALGVPYYSWRYTHAKHHASTGHMTQDQVFVPKTRSQVGLRPFDPKRDDRLGARVSAEVQKELQDALGDAPLGTFWNVFKYVVFGWPMYLIRNASGQRRYPRFSNHFNPKAVMFSPHQFFNIVISDVGVVLWIAALVYSSNRYSFATVFKLYLSPYLWVNHWLVLITFLQHTDPYLPHYRPPQFNFQRGALATLDRSLLGDLGSLAAWIGAHATCGISETHVAHHICSKIPHYHAWEATYALRDKVLGPAGIRSEGGPAGWAEIYRVMRECRFVEDEGDVVFYKNARGVAQTRAAFNDFGASDSGVEIFDGHGKN
uniref:Fatty acid desaturase domain-containing protein n=1 Tax=Mycena chlorophos TaxID=658473 RepID=A0ABQ0M568_MYCCL|nr:predicted protein [Mycena chlorophos]